MMTHGLQYVQHYHLYMRRNKNESVSPGEAADFSPFWNQSYFSLCPAFKYASITHVACFRVFPLKFPPVMPFQIRRLLSLMNGVFLPFVIPFPLDFKRQSATRAHVHKTQVCVYWQRSKDDGVTNRVGQWEHLCAWSKGLIGLSLCCI